MKTATPKRPEKTINATCAVAVLLVEDEFVIATALEGGRWCLPTLEVPPDYGLPVVLRKFLKDIFDLELRDLLTEDRVGFGPVHLTYSEETNIRTFQHPLIVRLSRDSIADKPAPEGFGMLPLGDLLDAPADILAINHHPLLFACCEVGK